MKSRRDEATRRAIPGSSPRPDREHRKPQPTTCYTVVCVKTAVEISEESRIRPRTHESASSQVASLSPMFFGAQTLSFRFAPGGLTKSRTSHPGEDVQANEEISGRSPEEGYISYVRDLLHHPSRADELRGPASPHAVAGPKATRAVGADRPRSNGSERPHPPNGFRRDIRSTRPVSCCLFPC